MDKNETAVIICNYNGGEDTVKCIEAVIHSKDIKCDIYVVDNASTDGSADRIGRQFGKKVTILQNAENFNEPALQKLMDEFSLTGEARREMIDAIFDNYIQWSLDAFAVGLHLGLSLGSDVRRGRPQQV